MKILTLFLVISVASVAVSDPNLVLIHYDSYGGYGEAVLDAAFNIWPSATILPVLDDWPLFNNALTTGPYDIIVLENWNVNTDDCDWATLNTIYTTSDTRIFLSDWKLSSGGTGVQTLMNTMGASSAAPISGGVIPHYAWEPAHDICMGIADWNWMDPGLGILNNRLTVSDAFPVTGWSASPTAGEAAICVANDGRSVISGFTPAYAVESQAIWENILIFMWDGGSALQQGTWGSIKASF